MSLAIDNFSLNNLSMPINTNSNVDLGSSSTSTGLIQPDANVIDVQFSDNSNELNLDKISIDEIKNERIPDEILDEIKDDIKEYLSQDIEIMHKYIQEKKSDSAMELRDEAIKSICKFASASGYVLDEKQASSLLNEAFKDLTESSLVELISENIQGSFITGLLEGIPLVGLMFNSTSKDEALSEISGIKPKKINAGEILGAMSSGFVSGAGVGSFFGLGVGTIVGGIFGAIAGGVQYYLKTENIV